MDEAHEILLSSLKSSGISLPAGVSSINDFSSDVLISTCSQSLRLILDSAHSFPTSIPSAAAERFNICAEVASAIKSLGYREELSFHQKLIRYLDKGKAGRQSLKREEERPALDSGKKKVVDEG
ncbi:hypothetical protein KSP40_PGU018781 [Platanthera guangdongensis]|uniref:CCDC22 N-terminal domain-containing protein n=1 Tax=Platanthera guangdongensis TaxID=2320717 RepID=A0ABR2LTM5_9ASPA